MTARSGRWATGRSRVLGGTVIALVAVAAVVALRANYRAPTGVTIAVSPATALLDEPVAVSVRGLPAGTRTTVTARATDAGGAVWSASAEFDAGADGVVSLGEPSLGGSYTGPNPMGLFQFMIPMGSSAAEPRIFLSPEAGYDVTLTATVGRRVDASATVRRQAPAAVGVTREELRPARGGVFGDFLRPRDTAVRRPAVLVFGRGPGIGSGAFTASLLAAHGYPSLALAYYGEPGLPPELADIPLEYFVKALAALRARPGVDQAHVLVLGVSRGSEAALLVGAHFPDLVDGVVAGVPSAVANTATPEAGRAAWTVRGRPVPAVPPSDFGRPEQTDTPGAVIPVERIRGPVLLSCGGLDVVWSSCGYADAITRRLAARHFRYPYTVLRYADAGHFAGEFSAYYSLTDGALTSAGGTVKGTQVALAQGHARLLAFLAAQ